MKNAINGERSGRTFRSVMVSILAMGLTPILLVTGLTIVSGSAASAATPRTPSAPCNVAVTAGTGMVAGSLIIGVTAGTTKISFNCNDSSNASIVAEASLLSGIGTTSVNLSAEADTAALGSFTASTTSTGCPAGVAGQCTLSTFTVPAAFTAADAKAACPPTQAQINAGLFGCALAAAAGLAPVPGAEYLMTYVTQATLPNAPTITATPTAGPAGSTIKVGDAAANAGYWWANVVQQSQAIALGTTALAAPATCATGGGYGSVPAPFLEVNWFAQGNITAIPGSAAGVSISNACYDGTTLHAPALSGTITVPPGLTLGTTYHVYLCELNVTAYPSNDANATANCGAAPGGASWIDASFTFTAALAPITQIAPTSGTTGVGTAASAQLNVTGNNGAVSFVASSTPVPGLSVSPTGLVTGAASLAAGPYTISGTDSDTSGDSGTWTYTLSVGTAQAALTLTSVAGTAGRALMLVTSGGSGTGAVSYAVTNGTASGCAVSGSSLTASSAGTCTVVATKAGDSTYLPISSSATSVSLTRNNVVRLLSSRIVLKRHATVLPLRVACGSAACAGSLTVTARVVVKIRHGRSTIFKVQTLTFGTAGYLLSRNSSRTVTIHLTASSRNYLASYPNRPNIRASVTDNVGAKHTYIGTVTLVK